MVGMEKDILLLISRVRCMTEIQAGKVFNSRKKFGKKPIKKTLRKMCNEYTLRKYPVNINYAGYKDNSYVYYLNGSQMYKGKDLIKVLIGSELAIKIDCIGCEVRRFYRNVNVGKHKYDLFIEYRDQYDELKQILVDIELSNKIDISKYKNISADIYKSTIPFYEVPKILVVTSEKVHDISLENTSCNIDFIDPNFTKLVNHL